MSTKDHPVWSVYDELRTARLNVKYLQREIAVIDRWNKFQEIIAAVSTSSAIAGFSFWSSAWGGCVWKAIGGLGVVFSALKPILRLSEKLKDRRALLAGYSILEFDLQRVRDDIAFRRRYDEDIRKQVTKALQRKAELVKQGVPTGQNKQRIRICQEEVARELPASAFYVPPESPDEETHPTKSKGKAGKASN